jgi:hypothetical protein
MKYEKFQDSVPSQPLWYASMWCMHTGCAGLTGDSVCSPGPSGHFGGSHAMIAQSFENSLKSVFCRTLGARMDLKGWFDKRALDSAIGGLSRTAVTLSQPYSVQQAHT